MLRKPIIGNLDQIIWWFSSDINCISMRINSFQLVAVAMKGNEIVIKWKTNYSVYALSRLEKANGEYAGGECGLIIFFHFSMVMYIILKQISSFSFHNGA